MKRSRRGAATPAAALGESLAASAGCAWTDGRQFSAEHLRRVITHGRQAAEHGRYLPLPVLLDVSSLLEREEPLARASASPNGYDRWLREAQPTLERGLGLTRGTPAARRRVVARAAHLPFLLHWYPRVAHVETTHGLRECARAFAGLGAATDDVHARWKGPRHGAGQVWSYCWPAELPPDAGAPAAKGAETLWALFQAARAEGAPLHESFDHAAARLYLDAEEPSLHADQRERVRLLHLTHPRLMQPFWDAVEEPHPAWGLPDLATATLGELGKLKIVNGSGGRLNNPTASVPPPTIGIHLAWTIGYPALIRSAGSRLQALVALLADDWRAVLDGLPVTLTLHRGAPQPLAAGPWDAGPRWRTVRRGGRDRVAPASPPPSAVAALFERVRFADAARREPWRIEPDAKARPCDWWCGIAVSADLVDGGLERLDSRRAEAGTDTGWEGPASAIPDRLTHMIVVDEPSKDDASEGGEVYRVHRPRGGHGLHLRPLRRVRPRASGAPDDSFRALRVRALDAVIDALEERL